MSHQFRVVAGRTARPDETREAAGKVVESPSLDSMMEAIHNPAQLARRIVTQEAALNAYQQDKPGAPTVPAPPSMSEAIIESRKEK